MASISIPHVDTTNSRDGFTTGDRVTRAGGANDGLPLDGVVQGWTTLEYAPHERRCVVTWGGTYISRHEAHELEHRESAELKPVKTKSGWAVSGGQPYYLHETKTKREALAWIAWAYRTCEELAAREREQAERLAEHLASRGLEPVDYRDIQPGDRYTSSPYGPICTVTKVEHMASGSSMIWHPTDDMPPGSCDGFTLHTRSVPAYRLIKKSK